MEETAQRRRGLPLLPLILIGVGVLILLANLGVFNWTGLLGLLNLWPLLLIALGADLLTAGRFRAVIVLATVVVAALAWTGNLSLPGVGPVAPVPAETHQVEHPLAGASRAAVRLDVGVSRLSLGSLSGSVNLIEGEVRTGRGEVFEQDLRLEQGVAMLELSSEERFRGFDFGRDERRRWDLNLSPEVPIDLSIDAGVGQVRLDLRDLDLSRLDLDAGVGEVVVTLPDRGRLEASFDTGVGATTIHVPQGVAVRLQASTGIGNVRVLGDFVRDGDLYLSPGYDGAQHRVDLRINGGVGAVTVERTN